MDRLYGGIEAGGTKFICVVGTGPDEILAEARLPTTTPQETLQRTLDFFRPYLTKTDQRLPKSSRLRKSLLQDGELAAVGIGAFGPLDLDPRSPTYGFITTTPKSGWAQVDLCGEIGRSLGIPVALDTDVNSAAIGERFWIAENRLLDPFLYITVGTGIGVGGWVNGRPLHGLVHPEAGHSFIPHSWDEDPFEGICPYHGDCLEGLASGPAIARRWGIRAENLPAGHPGWELEVRYLALGICNLVYTLSPQRIVLGGGVLGHPGLIERIRQQVTRLLNGYIHSDCLLEGIDSYIVSPGLGGRAGVLGALAMAMALEDAALSHQEDRMPLPTGANNAQP